MLYDIALACEYIHSLNVIHGDLKPDNVLLMASPGPGSRKNPADQFLPMGLRTKVADFGFSTHMGRQREFLDGIGHGTPLYMGPELLDDQRASKASDVFAFGMIMWELYHGMTAWDWVVQTGSNEVGGWVGG